MTFALVVDNFGIKYTHKEDVEMVLNILRQKYEAVSVDWSGKLFCDMNLEWDYKYRAVDVDMKGYIKKVRKNTNMRCQNGRKINPTNIPSLTMEQGTN